MTISINHQIRYGRLACLPVALLCLLLLALPSVSKAQRAIPHQDGLILSGGVPLTNETPFVQWGNWTARVDYTHYFFHADYLVVGVEYSHDKRSYTDVLNNSYSMPVEDYLFKAGYMYPILTDYTHTFLLYAGLSALCGYEDVNRRQYDLSNGATIRSRSHFVYGGAAHLSAEIFLTDNWLLTIRGDGNFLVGSQLNLFRPLATMGFRFNF